MNKKNIILTTVSTIIIATLVIISVVLVIGKKKENSERSEGNKGYGYVEDENEAKAREKLEDMIEKKWVASKYNSYGKPFMMFAEVLKYSEYETEYPQYDKFTSSEDYIWRCTENSISEENVGECIGKLTGINEKEYEIYKIEGISSEYAVAFKETEPDCYMVLINSEYIPENVQDFIEDTDIKNSDVEINMIFREQLQKESTEKYGLMTFIDKDEYLWNNFLGDNKYIGEDIYYGHFDEFNIYVYHKTLKLIYVINVNDKGNIGIRLDNIHSFEFESTTEEVGKFIEYISENYEAYKEESPVQGPEIAYKNELIND